MGEHRIVVKATNDKGSETAELIFTVNANPNMFTYISYGNNLGLTPAKDYASQFRGYSLKELKAIKYIPETDIPEGKNVIWKVKGSIQTGKITIDAKTGELTVADFKANQIGVALVTATVGESEKTQKPSL